MLSDAPAAVCSKSGKGLGYFYMIGLGRIIVCLVTWLDYSSAFM